MTWLILGTYQTFAEQIDVYIYIFKRTQTECELSLGGEGLMDTPNSG